MLVANNGGYYFFLLRINGLKNRALVLHTKQVIIVHRIGRERVIRG